MNSFMNMGSDRFEEKFLDYLGNLASQDPGSWDGLIESFHPYSWAGMRHNLRLLRRLSAYCKQVNKLNEDGTTALRWAPNWEFTRVLVSLGAKVSLERPDDGLTSVHLAAEKGRADQLELLLLEANGRCALEQFDYIGRTPLACAVYEGHLGVALVLLKAGADPNAVDHDRSCSTVFQFALGQGHDYLAKLLLEHGADPELSIGLSASPRSIAQAQLIDFPAGRVGKRPKNPKGSRRQ